MRCGSFPPSRPATCWSSPSGEREIRDTAEAIRAACRATPRDVEVLPLYARLPTAEQHRVFVPNTSRLTRRVVPPMSPRRRR